MVGLGPNAGGPCMGFKLVDNETGREIPIGSERETIKGGQYGREVVTITRLDPPTETNPTGRVFGRRSDGAETDFFPAYINAKFVKTSA